jgi:hypothetical protein
VIAVEVVVTRVCVDDAPMNDAAYRTGCRPDDQQAHVQRDGDVQARPSEGAGRDRALRGLLLGGHQVLGEAFRAAVMAAAEAGRDRTAEISALARTRPRCRGRG